MKKEINILKNMSSFKITNMDLKEDYIEDLLDLKFLIVPSSQEFIKVNFDLGKAEKKLKLTIRDCRKLWRKGCKFNILLITGKTSGVSVLDIDNDPESKKYNKLTSLFPFLLQCPIEKTCNFGYHIFLPYINKNFNYKTEFGEYLSDGKFCTMAYSRYKSKGYQGETLDKIYEKKIEIVNSFDNWNIDIKIPENFIKFMQKKEKKGKKAEKSAKNKYDALLQLIPSNFADNSYFEEETKINWLTILSNCKNANISFDSFDNWCQQSKKYDNKIKSIWDNSESKISQFESLGFIINKLIKIRNRKDYNILKNLLVNKILLYSDGEVDYHTIAIKYWESNVISIGESQKVAMVYDNKSKLWCEVAKSSGTCSSVIHHLLNFYSPYRENFKLFRKFLTDRKVDITVDLGLLEKKDKDEKKELLKELETIKEEIKLINNKIKSMGKLCWYSNLPNLLTKYSAIRSDEYHKTFDINPDVLACKNGLIDLKTGKLTELTKNHKITTSAPTIYDENINTNFVENLLKSVFGDMYEFIHMWLGYMITGRNNLDKYVIHVGQGSNFKSTLDNWMRDTIGGELYKIIKSDAITSSGGNNDYIYECKNSRCIVINEINRNQMFDPAALKSIATADTQNVMAKFKSPLTFKPKFKLNIFTNHKPVLPEGDFASYRRCLTVPYDISYLDKDDEIDKLFYSEEKQKKGFIKKKDKNLKYKLEKQNCNFLKWLVDGAIKYYNNNMDIKIPDRIKISTLNWIKSAQVLKEYMKDSFEDTPDNINTRIPIKNIYLDFLRIVGKSKTKYSQQQFNQDVKERGYSIERAKYTDDFGSTHNAVLCLIGKKAKSNLDNNNPIDYGNLDEKA